MKLDNFEHGLRMLFQEMEISKNKAPICLEKLQTELTTLVTGILELAERYNPSQNEPLLTEEDLQTSLDALIKEIITSSDCLTHPVISYMASVLARKLHLDYLSYKGNNEAMRLVTRNSP